MCACMYEYMERGRESSNIIEGLLLKVLIKHVKVNLILEQFYIYRIITKIVQRVSVYPRHSFRCYLHLVLI